MAWDVDLAKMFKERENVAPIGNIVGKVVGGLPNIKIAILDDNVILDKNKLYCCNKLLSHTRQGNISLTTTTETAQGHSHSVNVNANCTIDMQADLKVGDLVLMMHSIDEEMWFIVDKIIKM